MSVVPPEGRLDDASLLDLAGRFHDQHEADRGFAFRNQQPVVRGVRVLVVGRTPTLATLGERAPEPGAVLAPRATRPVHFGSGFVDTAVYDADALGPGAVVEGPALVEERFTVVGVPPGWRAALGDGTAVELTRG
jgi:N-methylhydantoinase A